MVSWIINYVLHNAYSVLHEKLRLSGLSTYPVAQCALNLYTMGVAKCINLKYWPCEHNNTILSKSELYKNQWTMQLYITLPTWISQYNSHRNSAGKMQFYTWKIKKKPLISHISHLYEWNSRIKLENLNAILIWFGIFSTARPGIGQRALSTGLKGKDEISKPNIYGHKEAPKQQQKPNTKSS